MKRKSILSLILLVSNFVLCFSLASVRAQEAEDTATLYLRVNTKYDDSVASLRQISLLIRYLEPSQEVLGPEEELSAFIAETFKVEPSHHPKTYALIEQAIVRLNKDVSPGPILVPTLPQNNRKKIKLKKKTVSMSTILLVDKLLAGLAEIGSTEEQPEPLPTPQLSEPNPDQVVYPVVVPLKELLAPEGQELLDDPNTAVVEEPMPIMYAGGAIDIEAVEDQQVLDDAERQQIKTWLSGEVPRESFVFILDSGWPSLDAYKEAKSILIEAYDQIWKRWAIPGAQRFKRTKEDPLEQNWKEPNNIHCQIIERSLREFRGLDPQRRVRVVYLPLMLEKQGGADLLQELLELHFIARAVDGPMGEKGVKINDAVIREARKSANSTVKKIQQQSEEEEDVLSNKALLQATWKLGNFIAERDKTVFFINESWTLRARLAEYSEPPQQYGFAVSATGNIPKKVITAAEGSGPVDFARRSLDKSDVIAVMNFRKATEGTGWQCNSSIVDKDFLLTTTAVGFNGRVSEKDEECMTSYAAPRVAWLLASAEALRPHPPIRETWPAEIKLRLFRNRSTKPDLDGLIFDPIKYIQEILVK